MKTKKTKKLTSHKPTIPCLVKNLSEVKTDSSFILLPDLLHDDKVDQSVNVLTSVNCQIPFTNENCDIIGLLPTEPDISALKPPEEQSNNYCEHLGELDKQRNCKLKNTFKSLEQTHQSLKLAIASGQVGIWDLNLVTNELIWDDTMFALYGSSRKNFSGAYDAWTTRLHPDDRAVTETALQDAISGKKTYTPDFRVIWANGEVHHIKGHAHVVTDKDGNPIHMLGTNWDNSAFAHTHQKLLLARTAINNSKSAFIWLTPDGHVADVNDFACINLGYTKNELISLHICDFDSEMTAESWPDIWKQLKKSGKNQHETFYRHKDGTFFPVEVINNYIAVNGQELCFSFINDITERKKIKQALRDANAFSVGILDSLTAHIAVLDEQGVIIAVNRAWKQFGKDNDLLESSHDTLGANYLDICKNAFNQSSGEEAKLVEAGIKSVLTGERETFHLKYPCHSTLQQRWFYMNVSPLQGSGRGVVVSHEDITERKLAQLKLQDKEQMLSESQRITHIGSWSIDLATGYISWSDEMYHIYGVTEETFDHTLAGFISLIHPDDRVAMQQWCNACLTGYASEDLDFRIVWPDGTIRLIRGSGGLQYDDMNRPFRAIGSAQDITERKERDQRDKEHLDQLAHITRLGLMGDMASGIVHEVNQPLTAIINYSQASLNFLKTENYDRVKLAETIQKVQQQASRTSEIIQKMREFIKSNAMQSLKADVNDLIKTVSILCAAQLKDNQINLVLELEKNLPLIDVDHIQIEQVIINLFRNSADALQSLPETIQRQLTVHSQLTPENELQISVKDNGPGLSAEQQEKLMTPFYTTKADGMGIGLSISRSIIEAHNGRLHFESLLGVGTVFYITLPI